MSVERPNAVTLRGNPFTLVGEALKVGDPAPDFEVIGKDMKTVSLADTGTGVRILSALPSLDTPVCDTMTRRFNQEASEYPGVKILTVSMDLPFAQTRWCAAAGVDNVTMLSDHRTGSFGTAFGTLIKELRLESRAIFVVDQDNIIRYAEYVAEVADQPDYDAALEVVRSLAE